MDKTFEKFKRGAIKHSGIFQKYFDNNPQNRKNVELARLIVNDGAIDTSVDQLRQTIGAWKKLKDENFDFENAVVATTETSTSTQDYDNVEITDRLKHECEKYGLPIEAVSSYKWVNHNNQEVLNIAFHPEYQKDNRPVDQFLVELEEHLKAKYGKYKETPVGKIKKPVLFVNIADLHVGLDPNENGESIWDATWEREDILVAAQGIIDRVTKKVNTIGGVDLIVVNLLGDLLDGFNKQTVRGGHQLPQTMSNIEQSDCCIEFLCRITEGLKKLGNIHFYGTSNSNHGGDFEHLMLQRFQLISQYKYSISVEITSKMALGYKIPGLDQPVVIMHGKDKKFAARPLPAFIKDGEDYKIEAIAKAVLPPHSKKPIIFKGDTHQHVDQDRKNFRWVACASCAPDSDWAKNNFFRASKGACTYGLYYIDEEELHTGLIYF